MPTCRQKDFNSAAALVAWVISMEISLSSMCKCRRRDCSLLLGWSISCPQGRGKQDYYHACHRQNQSRLHVFDSPSTELKPIIVLLKLLCSYVQRQGAEGEDTHQAQHQRDPELDVAAKPARTLRIPVSPAAGAGAGEGIGFTLGILSSVSLFMASLPLYNVA